ncbi:DUF4942 domain-containing protein [Gluconobacter thailandicus]|uniref:DUF4942 domain-containing protein n=1 Tax=Gluconobacter thailandicus TaxID=257438 RepID=A0AAP9EUX9_GLUTH|nr:DUF4942 domain-containing protein [Gluconobacter thailandicus]QEH97305.1 DUF4942 domain-containing protein [Gluconobacter thailandicus]
MDLAIRASIPELIQRRDTALRRLSGAMQEITEALRQADDACVGDGRASYELRQLLKDQIRFGHEGKDNEDRRISMDRSMWRSFVVNTPLWGLMDTQARKKFDQDMAGVPPEATLENLAATMEMYFSDADNIFRRSLIETFRSLPNSYKSNDPFKLDKKVILGNIQDRFGYLSTYAGDRLRDLDRVFWVLDGLEYNPPYDGSLRGAISRVMDAKRKESRTLSPVAGEVQTEYFTVKFFKNGNAHAVFMRPDLVQKANRLIAEHYGATLPGDTGRTSYQNEADDTRDLNYFPTPPDVVAQMVDAACIESGMTVLEPSAGNGAIIRAVKASCPGCVVQGYEIDAVRAKQAEVRCFDFMQITPAPGFDRILMNPPFSHGRWVRHILHAWAFLRSGGRLVAITPNGAIPAQFRAAWEDIMRYCVESVDIPAGAFRDAGTMISTRMIVFGRAP